MNAASPGVAVVSGAGSGIGRALALALANRGHALALVGRRAEPLGATLHAAGGRGLALTADVRDAAALARIARRVENELGAVEVVVPAAGIATASPFLELTAADFEAVVATNLVGAANLLRAFLPALVARQRGDLLLLLSVAARQSFVGWSAYAASKAGLLGLVEALRLELAATGVRVIAITPGATATPLWDELPGVWDRTRMISADEVARAAIWALDAVAGSVVEEIRLRPSGGDL
jgi:NADP-dependent 3-hydroxy acid dehydrogenase YdfG